MGATSQTTGTRLPRVAAFTALAIAAIALIVVLTSATDRRHQLTILSPTATWMRPGLDVRIAGQVVGQVTAARPTRSGTAEVTIEIDNQAWPLPQGTTATFRWPGTIAFTNRYVQLTVPKPNGHWLSDGGVIAGADVDPSVELDQVFDTFDPTTRGNLKRLLDEGGSALKAARPGLTGSL